MGAATQSANARCHLPLERGMRTGEKYGAPQPRGASCVEGKAREERKERKGEKGELSPGIGHAHSAKKKLPFCYFFDILLITSFFSAFFDF